MDSYQAVYDAVRSRIGSVDGYAITEGIVSKFDFSHHAEIIRQEFVNVAFEQQRPAILLKPSISIDGNQWCVLYGEDLQSGVAGFGDSPYDAMLDFDKNFCKKLNTSEKSDE